MTLIRNAGIEDIPLIKSLTMRVWPQTYIPIVGEEQVKYMLDQFYTTEALTGQINSGHRFIIGNYEGAPSAFASWSQTEPHVYKLHKLYIAADMQGRGIGRDMIIHIINELKATGATFLFLNVNRYNVSARAFYEKIGFHHVLDEDIPIGNGYFMNDHVLSLTIN